VRGNVDREDDSMWTKLAAAALAATALASPAGAAEHSWRHSMVKAKSDAGIVMMVTKGFAEKQGLKLDITQVQSDTIALKALLAGELDSYEGGPGGAMIAASRGVDVKVVGCQWPGLPHGIFVRSNIHSVKDLVGKTVAISQPGAMPDELVRTLLAKDGVPADKVKFANLGGDNDRYKALVAGVADAAVISGEYTPIAAKAGVHMLVAGRDVLPDYMRVCIMTTGAVIKAKHDDLVHFLAAEMAALHYAMSHRAEAIALTQEITGLKPDDPRPAYIYDDAVRTHAVDPDINLPVDKLDWMQQQQVKAGDQPHPADLSKVADPGPRLAALKLVASK
jgi:NitT/TauT family transport system substrate-binding protein